MSARARQWLLLCGLALAVVGMHHVPLAPVDAAPHSMAAETHAAEAMMTPAAAELTGLPQAQSSGSSGTGMGHDLLHLCMVVLCATGGLLLLAWLLVSVTSGFPGRTPGLRPPTWQAWRLPRMTGRSLLTFVCISRI